MSLTSAITLANSGLNVSARRAEAVSSNVANAATPGYARRGVEQSSGNLGGTVQGVAITAQTRATDPVLTAARRDAEAALGREDTLSRGTTRLSEALGAPGEPTALSARIDALDAALSALAATPESASRQAGAVSALASVTDGFNDAARAITTVRSDADRVIAATVEEVNAALTGLERLNASIRATTARGGDASGLLDHRDGLLDTVARAIPLRVVEREGGQVALFSDRGAVLLDGRARTFEFAPVDVLSATDTVENGRLSGLTLDGRAQIIGTGQGPLAGGALDAAFQLRDLEAVGAQAALDALAFDLSARLSAADPSLAPGAPGLLTDAGAPPALEDRTGLAGRLTLNPLVDAAQGGQPARLRDGLMAPDARPSADSTVPTALRDALRAVSPLASDPGGAARDTARHLASVSTALASAAFRSGQAETMHAAEAATLRERERDAVGVNTDAEMQALLQIETAYQANARVIAAADDMLRRLLEL